MGKRRTSTKIAVLLDTEVYVRCGLNFENAELKQLIEYVKDGEIELLTTDIINREVRFRLRKKADDILGRCRSLASELSRIKNDLMLSGGQALKALLAQNFQDALSETFDHFLRVTKAREIPIPQDVVKTILDDYFAVRAPFGTGEKRKEFPEAISICAAIGPLPSEVVLTIGVLFHAALITLGILTLKGQQAVGRVEPVS